MTDLLGTGGIILDTPINRGNMPMLPVITGMDLGEKPVSYDTIWTRALNNSDGTIYPIVGTDRLMVEAGYYLSHNVSITKDGSGNMVFTDAFGTHLLADLAGGGGMVYPGAGISISTGAAWGTSITPSTGYLRYTGSAYEWLNETYSISGHTQAESTITFTNITTGDATTLLHGYLPKLGGGTTNYLRADGTWEAPVGTTYSVITTAEIDAGSSNTSRLITGARAGYIIGKSVPIAHLTNFNHDNIANGQTAFGWGNHAGLYTSPTGTPVDNQLAIWTNATTIEGNSNLTFVGSTLSVTGDIKLSTIGNKLIFGDDDSYLYESLDDQIMVYLAAANRWRFTATQFRVDANEGPALQAENPTATNPVFCTINSDATTGIGGAASTVSLIVSSTERLRVDTTGVKLNIIDELTASVGTTINGVLIKSNLIDAQAGSLKHLVVTAGDASGAAGTDAGNITIKAGNAINADSGSIAGNIFLVPGSPHQSSVFGNIYLGNSSFTGSAIGVQPEGTAASMGLYLYSKGAGSILQVGSGSGVVILRGTYIDLGDLQWYAGSTLLNFTKNSRIKATNGALGDVHGRSLEIIGGTGFTDGNGGSIKIEAGAGDGIGTHGNIILIPALRSSPTTQSAIVYIGADTSANTQLALSVKSSAINANLLLSAKGTGNIFLQSSTVWFYNTFLVHSGALSSLYSGASYDFKISAGQASNATNNPGKHLYLEGGGGDGTGNGGNLYIRPGAGGVSGSAGSIFIGSGSVGYLPAKTSETNAVYYDTTTGKLSYGVPAGGSGDTTNITWVLAAGEAATTGTNKTNVITMPRAGTITRCTIYAKTGPTGAALICDININGTSIWASTQANRIQIASGSQSGVQTSFDTTSLAQGDLMTVDIDQIGSTVAGMDVTVILTIS